MIELIYLHIPFALHLPKLTDTSFSMILKSVYGDKATVQVHIINDENDLALLGGASAPKPEQGNRRTPHYPTILRRFQRMLEPKRLEILKRGCRLIFQGEAGSRMRRYGYSPPEILPEGARVIHGSFSYSELLKKYGLPHDIPLITWITDPIDLVISSYFGLHRVMLEAMKHDGAPPAALRKMERTLMEFARQEVNRNGMSKLFAGLSMKDFVFVGIVEHFKEDLRELAELLGWQHYEICIHEDDERPKMIVSREVRAQIAELNQNDVELYRVALARRQERHE